mmetsp:Transcript_52780/g.126065  ORF Transcript_52780/g.126065 Transcript_52780/m.126065 type:complete len:414 (-) Transcript_52780:172-1413(-)
MSKVQFKDDVAVNSAPQQKNQVVPNPVPEKFGNLHTQNDMNVGRMVHDETVNDESCELLQMGDPGQKYDAEKNIEVHEPSVWVKVMNALGLGMFYVCVSSSMIFLNKQLLIPDRFPFPAFLTMSHQVTSFILASCLRRVYPDLFPAYSVIFPPQDVFKPNRTLTEVLLDLVRNMAPFFVLSFGFAVSLIFGNYAYTVAPVTFLQMIKEAQIAFIYPLCCLLGLDTCHFKNFVCIVFIAVFGGLAIGKAPAFSALGLLTQGTSSFAGAMQQVITQRVMSRWGGAKIDPLTMVLCSAPTAFIWLVVPSMALWSDAIPLMLMVCWKLVLLSNVFAFGLQVTMAIAIQNLSAVGLACCSVVKDVLIVIIGGMWLGEDIGMIQLCGFIGVTISISIYSAMKLNPEWFECRGSSTSDGS